jgi:hypothetical protein
MFMLCGCSGGDSTAFDFGNANMNNSTMTYGEQGILQSFPFRLTNLDGETTVLCDEPNCTHTAQSDCKAYVDTIISLFTIVDGKFWYVANTEDDPLKMDVVKCDLDCDNREIIGTIDGTYALFGRQAGDVFAFSVRVQYAQDGSGMLVDLDEPYYYLCIVNTKTDTVTTFDPPFDTEGKYDISLGVLGTDGVTVDYTIGYMPRKIPEEERQAAVDASIAGDSSKILAISAEHVAEYYTLDIATQDIIPIDMSKYQILNDEVHTYIMDNGLDYGTGGCINGTNTVILSDSNDDFAVGYLAFDELKNNSDFHPLIYPNKGYGE